MRREKQSLLGGGRRGVLLTGEFYRRFTGRPGAPESLMEWLYTPEHSLACAVNEGCFTTDAGSFLPCAGSWRPDIQRTCV